MSDCDWDIRMNQSNSLHLLLLLQKVLEAVSFQHMLIIENLAKMILNIWQNFPPLYYKKSKFKKYFYIKF